MRRRILFLLLAIGMGCVGCTSHDSDATPPQRVCGLTVWHKPSSDAAVVEVVGDWNDWARPGRILPVTRADGWRVTNFDVAPSEHTYAIIEDGVWLTDNSVPTTAFHGAQEVTWVDIASCEAPMLRVDKTAGTVGGDAMVAVSFLAARSASPIDPSTIAAKTKVGRTLDVAFADPTKGVVTLTASGLPPGKHTFTVTAKDTNGADADEAIATVWIAPAQAVAGANASQATADFDLRDAVIYQVMIDRFRNEAGPVASPPFPSARAGGTVVGVTKAIEAGELSALGVNMVWLSPLYKNPIGTFPGADGRPYSSYHGYWPSDSRALDPLVASESDLDALIDAAHTRGIRVLFDVVPHHVHEQNQDFTSHVNDGWFEDLGGKCICGVTCDWATHIEDCWFTPYLPSFDWKNPSVADQGASDVRWWIDRFDGDGVRIDAVPMMPRAATRRIVSALRTRFEHPGNKLMLLGENFTGPGGGYVAAPGSGSDDLPGGYDQLRYELGPYGLDSEFNFPLMWSLRNAIATGIVPLADIDATLKAGDAAWDGSGAVMGVFIGNHDVTRFASESAGDAAGDGWVPAPQSADPLVYQKQQMALAVVYTLPGAPVVYYGDEVGLAGRSDPDSRRVMPAEAELIPAQVQTRDAAHTLGRARTCSESLRRGSYRLLFADAEHMAYAREAPGAATAVVVLTRNPTGPLAVPFPGITAENYVDALTGRQTSLSPELTNLSGAPFSAQVLFPASSPCAHP